MSSTAKATVKNLSELCEWAVGEQCVERDVCGV